MATQGLVTITRKRQVELKIVAGCNGHLAPEVAALIRGNRFVPGAGEAYEFATRLRFGCESCLVVVSRGEVKFYGEDRPSALYQQTFLDPTFNPRWEIGIADSTEVVEL